MLRYIFFLRVQHMFLLFLNTNHFNYAKTGPAHSGSPRKKMHNIHNGRLIPTKKSTRRDFSLQLPPPTETQKNARHNTRFWGPKKKKNEF